MCVSSFFFQVYELYLSRNFTSFASAQISSREKKIYLLEVKIKEALHQCLNERIDSTGASTEEGGGDGECMTSPQKVQVQQARPQELSV